MPYGSADAADAYEKEIADLLAERDALKGVNADLLAALKGMVDLGGHSGNCNSSDPDGDNCNCGWDSIMSAARAALAAAGGVAK